MNTQTKRLIGNLTIQIDRDICVGFGDCVDVAPELFVLDDEQVAIFRDVDFIDPGLIFQACEACPVDALEALAGSDGKQVS